MGTESVVVAAVECRAPLAETRAAEPELEGTPLLAHTRVTDHSPAIPATMPRDPAPVEPEPLDDEPDDTDRRIEIENADLMAHLMSSNFAESARLRLDDELDSAGSPVARHAVLLEWIERDRQAREIAAAITGRYKGAAPVRELVNHSIAAWLRQRP